MIFDRLKAGEDNAKDDRQNQSLNQPFLIIMLNGVMRPGNGGAGQ